MGRICVLTVTGGGHLSIPWTPSLPLGSAFDILTAVQRIVVFNQQMSLTAPPFPTPHNLGHSEPQILMINKIINSNLNSAPS